MNQIEIEKETLKNQLLPRLREEAKEVFNTFSIKGIDIDLATDIVAYLLLYKRMTIVTIAGILYKKLEGNMDKLSFTLENLAKADIIDYDGTNFITKFILDSNTQMEVDKYCYPLPMVEKPKKLSKNNQSPYLTVNKDSVILKDNYTDEDVNLGYLNHQNNIPLKLNMYSVIHNKNKWNTTSELSKANFDRFNKAQRDVLEIYKDREFYLTWKYDKRGRSYDCGYHIHIQSNDYGKSIIQFANEEKLATK